MGSKWQQTFLFARTFFKHPIMLGSLVPSSRYLTEALMKKIDWQRARVLVEYGPGVGTLTWAMLQRMRPDAVLVAIESSSDFTRYVRGSMPDPRLKVVHGSAADVAGILAHLGLHSADYIVSGIPYSTMPDEVRRRILHESCRLLAPEGAFLVYQFTGAVLPHLRQVFGFVSTDFELRNVLPARIFYCAR